jgi:uncharacterized protein (DUF488 family)
MRIYTIGYGNRPIGDFIELLRHFGVQTLVDTRSVPFSRFQVHFRQKALQEHLAAAGIDYLYLGEALGGKRVAPECLVDGQVDLARLYAHESFLQAFSQVEDLAQAGQVLALMCAELRPENCHRTWMLAPFLLNRGYEVMHIDEKGGLKTQAEVAGGSTA